MWVIYTQTPLVSARLIRARVQLTAFTPAQMKRTKQLGRDHLKRRDSGQFAFTPQMNHTSHRIFFCDCMWFYHQFKTTNRSICWLNCSGSDFRICLYKWCTYLCQLFGSHSKCMRVSTRVQGLSLISQSKAVNTVVCCACTPVVRLI